MASRVGEPVGHASAGSVELRLDPIAAGVREARRFVRDQLRSWGRPELEESAALVVSELVTNAVLHARSPVALRLIPTARGVQVRVADGAPAMPRRRAVDDLASSGRGLTLVAAVACEWGVDRRSAGKVVWATIEAPPAAGGGPRLGAG